MQPLSLILNACSEALQRIDHGSGNEWHANYCAIVDPASVLEMAIVIKSLLSYIEAKEGSSTVTQAVKARISGGILVTKGKASK